MARIDVSQVSTEEKLSAAIRDSLHKPVDRMIDQLGRDLSLKQILNKTSDVPIVYCLYGSTSLSKM